MEPDPNHTKLRLSREGLEAISRITTPIAAVAVCEESCFDSETNKFVPFFLLIPRILFHMFLKH